MAALWECGSHAQRSALLGELTGLDGNDGLSREAVLLDFLLYAIDFARKAEFGDDKVSALFSIMKRTFEAAQSGGLSLIHI